MEFLGRVEGWRHVRVLLPKEQIVPASEEVSAALAYMLEFIKKKNGR